MQFNSVCKPVQREGTLTLNPEAVSPLPSTFDGGKLCLPSKAEVLEISGDISRMASAMRSLLAWPILIAVGFLFVLVLIGFNGLFFALLFSACVGAFAALRPWSGCAWARAR